MAKEKTVFVCQNCGNEHPKWMGRCNECGKWNTLVEQVFQKQEKRAWEQQEEAPLFGRTKKGASVVRLSAINSSQEVRINSTDEELNRVLGGGIVSGSVTLLGGEPGIGKSTLLLQIALSLPCKVLYVSGEESQKQIKMRAERLSLQENNCYVLTETKIQQIFNQIKLLQPQVLIIDSIQTLYSEVLEAAAGSVSQIRECTALLIKYAKQSGIPVIIVGHITKDGTIAGPKILEHMVDTVLQFEGDRNYLFRILRSLKNRFGSTAELGIYQMRGQGLEQVRNPSELLISKSTENLSGTAISATLEGMRPLMIEVQALVSTAVYGTPQRSTTGFNAKRLNMLLAVLEKRAGFRLGAKDVFLNITGGITIDDPAIDLAVCMAILSSNEDVSLPKNVCFAAEVGLGGELRPVQRVEQRIGEAQKLGFDTIFVAKRTKMASYSAEIGVIACEKIEEVITQLLQ